MPAHRRLLILLTLGIFAVAVMGQDDACAGTETVNEPSPQEEPEDGQEGGDEEDEPAETAAVGDTLTLQGFEGLEMDVTLDEVEEGITGGEFDQPEGELVAVRLTLENTSDATYNDSPSNGATLVTDDDQQASSALLIEGDCTLDASVRIAPGDTRSVCIPFDVPQGASPRLFQFALDSGFAEQGGEWRLGESSG